LRHQQYLQVPPWPNHACACAKRANSSLPQTVRPLVRLHVLCASNSLPVEAYLVAFGDDRNPLPETVKVLDEIVTDFIIETCHEAAAVATHSRRAKIKVDDFKFMLRHDPAKLGKVQELLHLDKVIRESRKTFDENAAIEKEALAREAAKEAAKAGGPAKEGKEVKEGRGRKKADKAESVVKGEED
jgi:transcription initiation factor TFIID subunit 13